MLYRFGDFALDTELYELRLGEQRIEVEPKVYELLVLLLAADGRLLDKRELMDALWPDTVTTESSLTRLVSLARAALGEAGRDPRVLRTRHRRGYQIALPIQASERPRRPTARGPKAEAPDEDEAPAHSELAAIVYADMAGYSRHIAADREGTAARLAELRPRTEVLADHHRGRLADFTGDCFLATFPSAEDAVRFAHSFQAECAERNDAADVPRALTFRLGVHLGDLRTEARGVYGNGVNIAARLQTLAQPGGVCLSGAVHEQVHGLLAVSFEELGPQTLKNIERPVSAFRSAPSASAGAGELSATETAESVLRRDAVAVLPFDNLSTDPEQELFADGIVEDLITALSARRYFPVIARNSTFAYKGRSLDVRQIGRELGALYVLEGSVRRAGERLRVNVQLLQTESGRHLWAQRYDRELGDVFALQDEIVTDVFQAIEPELRRFEPAPKRTGRLDVWALERCGFRAILRRTDASTADALAAFDEALGLDRESVLAHAGRAIALSIRVASRWESDAARLDEALASARHAVELDRQHPWARGALGDVLVLLGRHEEGRREIERSIALDPSSAIAHWQLGRALLSVGEYAAAEESLKRALRLSPRDPLLASFLNALAQARFGAGDLEGALEAARASLAEQEGIYACCVGAASAALLGRQQEARELREWGRRIVPNLSIPLVEVFLGDRTAPADLATRLLEGLRRAGLPEQD